MAALEGGTNAISTSSGQAAQKYLWCLKDLSSENHTGEFSAKTIEEIIDEIGPANFSAIVTDSGTNIQNAREKYKNILNMRCMAHAINLISKDICSTSFANRILTKCNTVVTYFNKSHQGGSALREKAILVKVDLKNGRYHMYDCVDSIMRHKLKCEKHETLSTSVLSALRSLEQSIAALELQSCTLADCFLGLARLGGAIKKLPNNHRVF
ncbi:hypothetical protein RhiirB3_487798 [Rhizophagus irregularis]|nr:hypothetical protein RhiirB3_487798 [Rhizophagus irregularis]